MNDFWFLTTSNKPRLRDPTQVQQIIAKYWFDFDCEVVIETDGDGGFRLSICGDGWPAAWPLPLDTSQEEYYPDYETPGQVEFAEFLTEIAPFLMEPLIVQAIGTANWQFPLSAIEWHVCPDTATVTKTEFNSQIDAVEVATLAVA